MASDSTNPSTLQKVNYPNVKTEQKKGNENKGYENDPIYCTVV
jgi:hypothetical protein